jgi:hypothetical protein
MKFFSRVVTPNMKNAATVATAAVWATAGAYMVSRSAQENTQRAKEYGAHRETAPTMTIAGMGCHTPKREAAAAASYGESPSAR